MWWGRLRDWLVGHGDHSPWSGVLNLASDSPVALQRRSRSSDATHPSESDVWQGPGVLPARSLREAIQWTLLYGNVFEYPLTRGEVYRFLMLPGGSQAEVEAAIDEALVFDDDLETDGLFLYPRGQAGTVATRLRRGQCAPQAWRRARFYGRLIWSLPYVRMVAVTGALAMNNVETGDDIDFMVVTEPGRLWLTRGLILIVARFARARGDTLCPNYIISLRALVLEQRDLYTAHELAQMVPLHGKSVAERFWMVNAWCLDLLPNSRWRGDEGVHDDLPWILMRSKALGQQLLDLPLGGLVERWEQKRKIAKLSGNAPAHAHETLYTPDVCKGHADSHGGRILDRWTATVSQQVDDQDLRTRPSTT